MATDDARATKPKGLTALVWIEDRSSRIARGEADAVTNEGMHVTLAEAPGFGQGDEVAVRLSFERGARTVATAARVAWLRENRGHAECGLQWSGPPEERKDLEAWLSRAA
jgi:hypothetical protein